MRNSLARIFFVFLDVGVGIVPTLLFFAWIERGCALPWVGLQIGWPWVAFPNAPARALAAFDITAFLCWGALHSVTAQPFFTGALEKLLPPQAVRATYVAIAGSSAFVLMGIWQSTGIVLWALRAPPMVAYGLSAAIFWGLMALSGTAVKHFDGLEFLGLRQIYSSTEKLRAARKSPQLLDTGFYGLVRHPMYLVTLSAFLLAPVMTLDRMLVIVSSVAYLTFGIPVEERKLIGIFGEKYVDYRRRVPAVLPRPSSVFRALSKVG